MEQMMSFSFVNTGKSFKIGVIICMIDEIHHSRKKATIIAKESDPTLITLHCNGSLGVDRHQMKFGDELPMSNENGASKYGYSPIGEQCVVDMSLYVNIDQVLLESLVLEEWWDMQWNQEALMVYSFDVLYSFAFWGVCRKEIDHVQIMHQYIKMKCYWQF